MLQNILMTYSIHNFDLGYVQGMNDLLAPILVTIDSEPDAFWCFDHFMKKMASLLIKCVYLRYKASKFPKGSNGHEGATDKSEAAHQVYGSCTF